MLRLGLSVVAGLGAIGLVACGTAGERPAASSESPVGTDSNDPVRCEGVAGIKSLKIAAIDTFPVGFSGDRVYLTAISDLRCTSVKLDGTDRKPCPAPDDKTRVMALVGED